MSLTLIASHLLCVSFGACFGVILMGALLRNRDMPEVPKPYGSRQEWR